MHVWRRVEDTLGAGWLWRCWYVKVKTYCWLFQVILGSKNIWLPCLVLLASQMNVPWDAAHLKRTLWSIGQLGPCPSLRHGSDRPGERLKAIDQNLFQILMASVEHLYNWSPTLFVWSFEKTLVPPSWTSAGWPRPDGFDGTCDARRFFSTCCLYFSRLTIFTMHLRPTDNFELKAQIFINDHRKFSSHMKSPGVSAGAAASDVPRGALTIKQAVYRLRSK